VVAIKYVPYFDVNALMRLASVRAILGPAHYSHWCLAADKESGLMRPCAAAREQHVPRRRFGTLWYWKRPSERREAPGCATHSETEWNCGRHHEPVRCWVCAVNHVFNQSALDVNWSSPSRRYDDRGHLCEAGVPFWEGVGICSSTCMSPDVPQLLTPHLAFQGLTADAVALSLTVNLRGEIGTFSTQGVNAKL